MKKKDNRFEVIYKQGGMSSVKILVDKKTGVNYLFAQDGYGGGLCPLIGKDGGYVRTATAGYFEDRGTE